MSRRAVVLAVAAWAPLLSGCWLQPDFGPEHQNDNASETTLTREHVGTLHEVWSVPSGISGQPLVSAEGVFLGGASGGHVVVRSLDRSTGATRWERDLGITSNNLGGILSVAGGEVTVARVGGIDRLDAATGATLATVSENAADPSTAVVAGDVIVYRALRFGAGGGNLLVARDRATLQQLWTAPLDHVGVGAHGTIVAAQGHLYVGDSSGPGTVIKVFPLSGCGAPSCSPTATFDVPPKGPTDPAGEPSRGDLLAATDDGDLLVARPWDDGTAYGTDLIALTGTGTLDWTLPLATLDGVAVAGGTVFATGTDASTTHDSTLFARSDTETWRVDDGDRGQPIVAADLVFVPSYPNGGPPGESVAAVFTEGCGATECTELLTVDLGEGTSNIDGMSVSNGTLFVNKSGPDGGLYALRR